MYNSFSYPQIKNNFLTYFFMVNWLWHHCHATNAYKWLNDNVFPIMKHIGTELLKK